MQEEVVVGRTRVGYRRTTGRGSPLVMFHGLMDSAESWDSFAHSLSRPTIAFDLPGFGHSSLAGSDLDDWKNLYLEALGHLHQKSYFLIGHSLGGAVATALASASPRETRGLLLIAPAGYGTIRAAEILARPGVETLIGRYASEAMRIRPLVRFTYSNVFSNQHPLSDDLLDRVTETRRSTLPGIQKAMRVLRTLSNDPFSESPYRGAVSALWGKMDRLVSPASMSRLLDVYPSAQGTFLEHTGHHPQEERPGRTLRWIADQSSSLVRLDSPVGS